MKTFRSSLTDSVSRWAAAYSARIRQPMRALFARLASLPSLRKLPHAEKVALVKEVEAVCGWQDRTGLRGPGNLYSQDRYAKRLWGGSENVPLAWEGVVKVYPLARKMIIGLLDGERVSLHPLAQHDYTVARLSQRQGGATIYTGESEEDKGAYMLFPWLQIFLREKPFPFRRCPWCKKTVFVPKRNQKYCAPTCTSQAAELARKDKPERQEAVRRYNRALYARKKAKERASLS